MLITVHSFAVFTTLTTLFCLQGKRVIAFMVGGLTRSEMRVAHKLSQRLGREIIVGGTTVDNPAQFLSHLRVGRVTVLR